MKLKHGFTLMEIMVTIVIVGVLATLAVTYMSAVRESVADREANANLKMIQAAEKAYRIDMGTYFPSAGSEWSIAAINSGLRFSLSGGSDRNWDYAVWSTGCSRATRNGSGNRQWFLAINAAEPTSSGSCP